MPRPTWEAIISVFVDSDNPAVAWVQIRANKWEGWSLSEDGYTYAEEAALAEVPSLVSKAIQALSKDISPFESEPGVLVIPAPTESQPD